MIKIESKHVGHLISINKLHVCFRWRKKCSKSHSFFSVLYQ